ncbi:MAG: hypothetical protein ACNFW9_03350 [Candidatus Kerfeldbacteria bacterium]|jgi:hypothetical protein
MSETLKHNPEVERNDEVERTEVVYDSPEVETEEEKSPSQIRKILNGIRDKFKSAFSIAAGDKQLKYKLDEEIEEASKEAMREGVDFSLCQMNEILEDYRSGRKVEFESFSPYLADYDLSSGKIWSDKLTDTDKVGIEVAKTLTESFPKARLISLYDEYNTDMPDATDLLGKPKKIQTDEQGHAITTEKGDPLDAPQLQLSDGVKENFKRSVEGLLKEKGVMSEDATEGKEYLLISESEKIIEAEELVKQLEANGNIRRKGEAIYFTNPDAENPAYGEIPLRTTNGRWLCEALDASSYIKKENLDITHLVVLPEAFKDQQNKVWEVLRVLGIDNTHYHNIFFDEKQDPEVVARTIKEEIGRYDK